MGKIKQGAFGGFTGKEAWKMAWLKRVHTMSDEIVKLKLDFNASN